MTNKIHLPKREPDSIITHEDESLEEKYVYKIWFEESVIKYSSHRKNRNGIYSKKMWYTETRTMERWTSSLTSKTQWTTTDEWKEDYRLRDDYDFGLEDFPLEARIEKEYQNWLATKELEKHLK
jgi:hypothetical protein